MSRIYQIVSEQYFSKPADKIKIYMPAKINSLSNGKINSLAVVIPVFNEEKIIEKSLFALSATLKEICFDYEIVVVDDGSTDKTADLLVKLAAKISGLKVIRNHNNQGIGGALCKGFKGASKDLVFYIDADMPFDYAEILCAAEVLEKNRVDLVVGFRIDRKREPFVRRICSKAYNWCVRSLYGVCLKDINCAFKLMKASKMDLLEIKSKGSFVDAELVIIASYLGYKIQEMGVEYFPRQESNSRLFQLYPILRGFWEMVVFYPRIKSLKRIP